MFDIFKRRNAPASHLLPQSSAAGAANTFAPGTGIPYHPELMRQFAGHHATLRKLFAAIDADASRDDFAGAAASMDAFRRVLMTHLLEENLKLYTYLRKCLVNDDASAQIVRDMKREMSSIGTQVMAFLNGYLENGITPANKSQFLTDLAAVGDALTDRLQREESTLYTLYMPPEAFA